MGWKGKLKNLTKKQVSMIHKNMQASKAAYNFIRKVHLGQYEEYGKVRDEYYNKLVSEGKTDEEIKSLMEIFAKENFRNYISTVRKDKKYDEATMPMPLGPYFTKVKNTDEYWKWLKEEGISSYSYTAAITLDYDNAIKKFHEGFTKMLNEINTLKKKNPNKIFKYPQHYGFPQYKTENLSFSVQLCERDFDYENNKIRIPSVGWVKIWKGTPLPVYEMNSKPTVTVSTDKINYYIAFARDYEMDIIEADKTDVIGIDLGLKDSLILSNGTKYKDITKTKELIKLEEKKKLKQRYLSKLTSGKSRKFTKLKGLSGTELINAQRANGKISSKLTRKLQKQIRKIEVKQNNIKANIRHNIAEEIVKLNPKGIVFKGMQKNKKLAPKLQKAGMYSMKVTIQQHALKHGILVKEVSTWFPSSQICSNCGNVDSSMKDLSKRVYRCSKCGTAIDRDVNAAINLRNSWDANSQYIKAFTPKIVEYIESIS